MNIRLSSCLLLVLLAASVDGSGIDSGAMPLTLKTCTAGATNQNFSFITIAPYTKPAAVSSGGFCLQIVGSEAGSTVVASSCGRNPMNSRADQYWAIKDGTLAALQVHTPFCFGISKKQTGDGAGMLADCASPAAQFTVGFKDKKHGKLVHNQSGLCVTLTGAPPPTPLPPKPPPIHPTPPTTPPTPCPKKRSTTELSLTAPVQVPEGARPCDIYDAAGNPCVAAHSMVRALYSAYSGPLYMVRRSSDKATKSISVGTLGFADADTQDVFCADTYCSVETIFDQSPKGNHLRANHPGRHFPTNVGVNASALPIVVSGHKVYGAKFDGGMGYRNDNTTGLAVGTEPESLYAVFGGHHYSDVCCFDYGNAENHIAADAPGTMEAIYFGNCSDWWSPAQKAGNKARGWEKGPWLMADIEAGMYGGNDTFNPANSPVDFDFITLMLKGQPCEMSLKAGNAQEGALATKYDGGRPKIFPFMKKQGGLVLGTGGDNSDRGLGIFYEGAMTTGFVSTETDDAVQANIVSVGYKQAMLEHMQ